MSYNGRRVAGPAATVAAALLLAPSLTFGLGTRSVKLPPVRSAVTTEWVLNTIRAQALATFRDIPAPWELPTSASMSPDTAVFRTSCQWGWAGYRFFEESPAGASYRSCGPGVPPTGNPQATSTQFQGALNGIGHAVQKSTAFGYAQVVTSVAGSRAEVAVRYACPASPQIGVSSVVLRRAYRYVVQRHRRVRIEFSTATATVC